MKRTAGFTLVELLITMVILVIVLAASSNTFISMLSQYRQQSKITETSMGGLVGFEVLRLDLESAGFGLPFVIPSTAPAYAEATAGLPEAAFNDAPSSAPRPILSSNNTGFNGSDVLVIKAANIKRDSYSLRWSYLKNAAPTIKVWDASADAQNPKNGDYAVVLSPGVSETDRRTLIVAGGTWKALWNDISSFVPAQRDPQPLYVYVLGNTVPDMPFNRADYYLLGPAETTLVPSRCAPNAGVLVKAVIAGGQRSNITPIIDCVADLQVVYELDTDTTPGIDTVTDDISDAAVYPASEIRNKVKEVRLYVLTHEGQKDRGYVHPSTSIYVGDPGIGSGHTFDIGANVNYRWKLYSIVVQPKNIR